MRRMLVLMALLSAVLVGCGSDDAQPLVDAATDLQLSDSWEQVGAETAPEDVGRCSPLAGRDCPRGAVHYEADQDPAAARDRVLEALAMAGYDTDPVGEECLGRSATGIICDAAATGDGLAFTIRAIGPEEGGRRDVEVRAHNDD